ncbi:histone acetyltransferase, partial [Ceratobasidium sp. 394]
VPVDERQIARLATGAAVDVSVFSEPIIPKPKPALIQEQRGTIRFTVVTNDGSPTSLILLTGLKTLFQKQLPKMPREYIARLVYDRSSQGMAIVKRGLRVVGGITFRPFPQRGFAEIVFFAISSVHQVAVSVFDKSIGSSHRDLMGLAGLWCTFDEQIQDVHSRGDAYNWPFLDICRQFRDRVL